MTYKELYFRLFNQVTDTIEALKQVQCEMEALYMACDVVEEESDLAV